MEKAIYPELNYRMFIKCSKSELVERVISHASSFSHWYSSVVATDEGVTFETKEFTNLLCVISFYKSAVSDVDQIPFEEVSEDMHLDHIALKVDYISEYWANRCFQEMRCAISQCGSSCIISSPRVNGKTASVVCHSWTALSNLDHLLMTATRGYSKHPDCMVSNVKKSSDVMQNVQTDMKPLVIFGVAMLVIVMLLICLA